jgi:hypothetical protein
MRAPGAGLAVLTALVEVGCVRPADVPGTSDGKHATEAPAVPDVRFANAPPVTVVDDRRDVPVKPAERRFVRTLYHFDGSFYRLITRGLEVPRPRRALGVNALDEVPDSTWFTNRIGVRDLTADEIRRGAEIAGSPEPHKPWTVHSTKVGGASVGFIITDTRGERFLLKFDRAGHPETETAAEVIVSRLLWAAGYNVPEDHIVHLRPRDLVIALDAVVKDWNGERGRLDRAELERQLARVVHEPDGRIRGMASRMIDGKSLGGHGAEGVRAGDPNDRIPHELRRDLRGLYVLFSWLDQNDVKEDNSIDMWIADPADPRRHYVKHYLLDFGTSLGVAALFGPYARQSHAYRVDFPDMFGSLATLGLRERSWERRVAPGLRGVGVLDAAAFEPGAWKPETPAYVPFRVADEHDKLWGSRILMRFTREQIRAAVEMARLSDPRSADFLVETLIARQRIAARHWFSRKSPLDGLAVGGGGRALCFDDLMLSYGLAPAGVSTRYAVAAYDRAGRPLGVRGGPAAGEGGRVCAPLVLARDGDGYTIVRIDTRRMQRTLSVYVHVARDPATGAPRVIGVWRP